MIEYTSASSKKYFLLLNIRISINFKSHSAVRNLNKNEKKKKKMQTCNNFVITAIN